MASHLTLSDNELIRLLNKGTHSAYEEIYKRYWALLFRHAHKMLKNEEAAKDVVQDIFVMLWVKAPELAINTSLSAFLYSSVRNKILDIINRDKVKGNYLSSLTRFIEAGEFTTDNQLREKELTAIFEKEITFLPPKMRQVFELSRTSNLSYKEIATEMNITGHTVKKQLSNALKILRFKLETFICLIIFLLLK